MSDAAFLSPPQHGVQAQIRTGTVWIWLINLLPLVSIAWLLPYLAELGTVFYDYLWESLWLTPEQMEDPTLIPSGEEMLLADLAFSMKLAVTGLWAQGLSLLLIGVNLLLAWLDWRELGKRGLVKPFHWAWSAFGFLGAGNWVTVIGRLVVVKRRTGRLDVSTLVTFIAVNVVLLVVVGIATVELLAFAFTPVAAYFTA